MMLDWIAQNANAVTAIATAVIAAFTMMTAVLTWALMTENRRLRKAGTEPKVTAYLTPHPDGNGAINFVLANIGQGSARNVKFSFECDEADFVRHDVWLANDSNRACASVLPQGEKITALFGRSYDLAGSCKDGNGIILKPFIVNINYYDLSGKKRSTIQTLDVSQFLGLKGLFAKPPAREIADALNKIEKHLVTNGRKPATSNDSPDVTQIDSEYRQRHTSGQRED